ncbi:MAG: OmpH family outer membrane protein [Bacteroidales bacterium]|nr:OmpH family outer membrane protein [Bacteroidales bacterium]
MKRILSLLLVAFLLAPAVGMAQTKVKFGHLDYGEVIKAMPGIDTVQSQLKALQEELQSAGEEMEKEFQTKYQELQNSAATMSPALLRVKEDELKSMYARIQEFAQNMETDLKTKQLEMLKPFQEKLLAAIAEVAKEGGYAYIFDTSTLTYYETGDNIAAKVKAKLKIK